MSFTIIRPRDRQEWLSQREGGIGSSEVGTILGLNPYQTPYQLWRRKLGIDPPTTENFAMRAGHYLEDAVSLFYADETGKEIIKRSKGDWLIVNNDKPYLRVSPDRTFWLPNLPKNDRNKGILECKTTQLDIDKDNIPQHWFCQLQYQLGVAELEQGALAWLVHGRSFDYMDFNFDADFYKWMVEEVDRFWVDNILGKREPEAVNADDVLLRNPRHVVGKVAEADEETLNACAELKELKEQIAALDARKKVLEGTIKMAISDAEALVAPSGSGEPTVLATWKVAKDSVKFDEKRFAIEKPEIYKSYLFTQAGTRRFLIK